MCAVSGVALVLMNAIVAGRDYPLVGHDLRYYIPRLLDTDLHLRLNGPSIQWYTPSFGGGLPAFPNPQHLQHSILQVLTFFVNPWFAVLLSMAAYALIGFYGFYHFLRGRMGLQREASVLGAVFLIANGFYLEHMIVGHVGFQMFPLIAVLLSVLTSTRRSVAAGASVVALVLAVMVYQAGIYLIILLALSLGLTLPVVVLLDARLIRLPRVAAIATLGGMLALLIASPKISAVLAFMQHFPREVEDVYDASLLQAVAGLGAQLVGAMVIAPAVMLAGREAEDVAAGFTWVTGVGEQIGMWEIDTGLSPILLACLVAGAIHLVISRQARASWRLDGRQHVALAATVVIAWVLGRGHAGTRPGLSVAQIAADPEITARNPRVAATFIMPLSIVGAVCVYQCRRRRCGAADRGRIVRGIAPCPAVPTSCCQETQQRNFDVGPSLELAARFVTARACVTSIVHLPDSDALIAGGSSYRPSTAPRVWAGTFAGMFLPGEVRQIRDGHFNMTHPASLVFPAENGLRYSNGFPRPIRAPSRGSRRGASRRWRLPGATGVAECARDRRPRRVPRCDRRATGGRRSAYTTSAPERGRG